MALFYDFHIDVINLLEKTFFLSELVHLQRPIYKQFFLTESFRDCLQADTLKIS